MIKYQDKACKTCGETYTPTTSCNLYCSKKCRGKNSYYFRNYGLTEAQYEGMKRDQNYRCYLCHGEGFIMGNNNHSERLAVDHCHSSGAVRKLLCHNCNRALGLLKDNPSLMRKAADYIEEFSEGATTISQESTPKWVETVRSVDSDKI